MDFLPYVVLMELLPTILWVGVSWHNSLSVKSDSATYKAVNSDLALVHMTWKKGQNSLKLRLIWIQVLVPSSTTVLLGKWAMFSSVEIDYLWSRDANPYAVKLSKLIVYIAYQHRPCTKCSANGSPHCETEAGCHTVSKSVALAFRTGTRESQLFPSRKWRWTN